VGEWLIYTKIFINYGSLMNRMVQEQNNLALDIISVLLRKENHLRAIAKVLGESHSTVLRKLNCLEKDDVVGFRIEGRNKIFFLKDNLIVKNYIFQTESHKLVKLIRKHPHLEPVIEELLKKTNQEIVLCSYRNNKLELIDADFSLEEDYVILRGIEVFHETK
jgi:hypothetical protein